MYGKRRLPALLGCLFVTALCHTTPRQYAPHWQVGDWWVTKVSQQFKRGSYLWHLERYDVAGIAKVDTSDCLVLKARLQSYKGTIMQIGSDFYVRRSDLRVVRRVTFHYGKDQLLASDTSNYPLGLFGPSPEGEPRLPQFPLRPDAKVDTMFRPRQRGDSSVLVREIPGVAGATLVKRLLDDGDTTGRHVVRPTDEVYQVRSEVESDLKSDTAPGVRRITRSLQLWCRGQPWRLYEELVQYDGPKPDTWVAERTWLVASGHTKQ